MRTIGLIGGMSWESTVQYYRCINEAVKERLQYEGRWLDAGQLLADAARSLERAGADFLVLCTNTMHKVAPAIEGAAGVPLLHVADATADEITRAGVTSVGLLGTRFAMEQEFYRDRLRQRHGIDVIVPDEADRQLVHRVIYDELCLGRIVDESRAEYRRVIPQLARDGAQAVILGCTEISLLVGTADPPVPLFDTTAIHARRAVEWATAPSAGHQL